VDKRSGVSADIKASVTISASLFTMGLRVRRLRVSARKSQWSDIAPGSIPDPQPALDAAKRASTTSDRYAQFLQDAIAPTVQNLSAVTQGWYQKIAAVKTGLANDFQTRETDLEGKIQPLMAKRQQIADQIASLDQLSPIDRRLKSIFNPMRYDPRMLRGQLERVEGQISTYEGNYKELNTLRSGVAAATVDAKARISAFSMQRRQSTLPKRLYLVRFPARFHSQTQAAMLPMQVASQAASLQEHQRAATLGRLTTEETHSLFNEAQAAPDGTVTVQGMKFTVGDLQKADQANQQVDLSLHSLVNASRVNDLMTADKVEDVAISHMSLEQVSQALADQGSFRGVKLDMGKLTQQLGVLQLDGKRKSRRYSAERLRVRLTICSTSSSRSCLGLVSVLSKCSAICPATGSSSSSRLLDSQPSGRKVTKRRRRKALAPSTQPPRCRSFKQCGNSTIPSPMESQLSGAVATRHSRMLRRVSSRRPAQWRLCDQGSNLDCAFRYASREPS
jgi:hypothetical protein